MIQRRCLLLLPLLLAACGKAPPASDDPKGPGGSSALVDARKGFKTNLVRFEGGGAPAPPPPPGVFDLVRYEAPKGSLSAYVTPDPKDGKKRPAIVWITGGECNAIDASCWDEGPPANDQSASAYRRAGIVMMFPTLRGGNDDPGPKEGFLGEVDDVIAAGEFLRKRPYVDPDRIYLGGHSTGGTLVLLTAECTSRFRAVFSFGPADDVAHYPPEFTPFETNRKECDIRAPIRWLHAIQVPVFVFEGSGGNLAALQDMARTSKNPKVRFIEVRGADHFNLLAPVNRLIAEKIVRDTGPNCDLDITEADVNAAFRR